jgi:hypothetical protein
MWATIAAIGIVSMIGLAIYDRMLVRGKAQVSF